VNTYVDSSALVAVYVTEKLSAAVRNLVQRLDQIPFNSLHRLEVSNAFELLLGRGLIGREEHRAIRAHLDDDLESQRLVTVALDLDQVFADA
jgi:predicted nucleic acid-binding protein